MMDERSEGDCMTNGTEPDSARASASAAKQAGAGDSMPQSHAVQAEFPLSRLLAVHVAAGAGLIILWAVVHQGWNFAPAVYKGVLLGLCAAIASHILGTVIGAVLTPGKGIAASYLASTVARFMLTPILALSLYFLLLAEARPVLIGSLVGYLLILVADIVTMMRALQPTPRRAS